MKKNLTKRLFAALMCATMVLPLASCGEKNNDGEIVTLKWYVPGNAQSDLDSVLAEVNKITEKEIGAKVDLQFIDQASFTQRISMLMASGEEFDLTLTGYVNPFQTAWENGGLMDITEYVEKDKDLKKLLPDLAWEAASFDGEIYAVPNEQIWANCQSICLREDLVKKYNFDVEKLKSYVGDDDKFWGYMAEGYWEKVKEQDPDLIPFKSDGNTTYEYQDYDTFPGYAAYDIRTGKVVDLSQTDFQLKYFKRMNNWFKNGYMRKDILTVTDTNSDWNAGRYASGDSVYKPGVEIQQKQLTGRDWIIIPFTRTSITRGAIQATMTAVSATSKNPDKAIELIKLVNTNEDLYRLICHGIEGKHYEKLEDGTIRLIADSGYDPQGDWKFGNQYNAYVQEGQPLDVWEQTKKMNDEATPSPLIGFSYDKNDILTETTEIDTVGKKYHYSTMTDVDKDYAAWASDIKKAGSEKVRQYFEEKINEYLASK